MKRQEVAKKRQKQPRKAPAKVLSFAVSQPDVRAIDPKWRWHYDTLLALRGRLVRSSEDKFRQAAEPVEGHSTHPADSATDEFDHDVAMALLAREENALCDVNDAVTRILEGRYGICEASGVKIPAERLRALPWCRYSLETERRVERDTENMKCRVPDAVSLRGQKCDLPGTGTITRGDSEGPAEEPRGRDKAKKVEDESNPRVREIEEPFGGTRRGGTPGR